MSWKHHHEVSLTKADTMTVACRMCLFLQAQNFQRHTEHTINMLYSSSQHASEQLQEVEARLKQSTATMHGMDAVLTGVATAQKQQLAVAEASLQDLAALLGESQAVREDLQHALQNEVSRSITKGSAFLLGFVFPSCNDTCCHYNHPGSHACCCYCYEFIGSH